jgi:hypothetical protein
VTFIFIFIFILWYPSSNSCSTIWLFAHLSHALPPPASQIGNWTLGWKLRAENGSTTIHLAKLLSHQVEGEECHVSEGKQVVLNDVEPRFHTNPVKKTVSFAHKFMRALILFKYPKSPRPSYHPSWIVLNSSVSVDTNLQKGNAKFQFIISCLGSYTMQGQLSMLLVLQTLMWISTLLCMSHRSQHHIYDFIKEKLPRRKM